MIKGALGAPLGHQEGQVDTRFVHGQKFRNRKRDVHHRKALERRFSIYKNRFTGSQEMTKKNKKIGSFLANPTFLTKNL